MDISDIEELYATMNIYRCLIVYDDDCIFELLKQEMIAKDYCFSDDCTQTRIYTQKVERLEDIFNLNNECMDMSTVSLVITLSQQCSDAVKLYMDKFGFNPNCHVLWWNTKHKYII